MSLLLTSLVLCLFQTTEPELELDQSLQEYRQAMHYIDVRGDYAKGVEILERIALAGDVLAVPGQSSWILAQSTRASTLAGEGERVLPHLEKIRNSSLGTRFEQPVHELLLSFAAEGAGLNPEFLNYLAGNLHGDGPYKLTQEYGRDLLPYLRHFIDSPAEFRLAVRLKAMEAMLSILEPSYQTWLLNQFKERTFWSSKVLSSVVRTSPSYAPFFFDSEARESFGGFLVQIAKPAFQQNRDAVLDASLEALSWRNLDEPKPTQGENMKVVVNNVLRLIEEGNHGKDQDAFATIAGHWKSDQGYWNEMGQYFAEHADKRIRNLMRTQLTQTEGGQGLARKWAESGKIEDELRFCFSFNPLAMRGFSSHFLPRNPEEEWVKSSLLQIFPDGFFINSSNQKFSQESFAALSNLKQTKHPLVRYLATRILIRHAHPREAVEFLKQIGDDSLWAQHFLSPTAYSNSFDLKDGGLEIMLALLDHPQLGERVREIVNDYGGPGTSIEIWEKYNLSPSANSLNRMSNQATEENDVSVLLWLTLKSDLEMGIARQAARALAGKFPLVYLGALDELTSVGRREHFLDVEYIAWYSADRRTAGTIFEELNEDFEWFLFHTQNEATQASSFDLLAARSPRLAIQMAIRHQGNLPVMRNFLRTSGASRIRFSKDYAEESTKWVLTLMQSGLTNEFNDKAELLNEWVSPTSEFALPVFEILWTQTNPTMQIIGYRIKSTAKSPVLRNQFHAEMVRQLQVPKWTKEVSSAYMYAGATEEILDACLELLQGETSVYNCKNLIETISKVDDPRVIEALLGHLNDPRQGVPEAASEGLDYLRKLRTQKQEWAAWASGNGAKSPVAALLNDLKDPEKEIRLAAIASLGTMKSTEALPALVNLLRETDEDIKEAARKALTRINAEPKMPEEIVEDPFEPKEPKQ